MAQESNQEPQVNLLYLVVVVASWLAIMEATPLLNNIFHFRQSSLLSLLAALRMTLLLLATCLYVRLYEKQRFAAGFRFRFEKIGWNIFWAFLFFIMAIAVLIPYQSFVVRPLLKHSAEASMAAPSSALALKPFFDRFVEFAYVLYEGIIEVLVFIGFLVDRLARRWNWPRAIIAGNLVFALWHYRYWEKGLLEGSLMIGLTSFAGAIISLNYWKTKNTFSSAACHTLVDLPNSIRELLGML